MGLLNSHKDLCEREELLEGRARRFRWFGPNLSEGNLEKSKVLREELEQVRTNIVALEWKLEDAIAASIKESEEAVEEAQRVLDEMYPLAEAAWPQVKLKNAIWENRHLDISEEE